MDGNYLSEGETGMGLKGGEGKQCRKETVNENGWKLLVRGRNRGWEPIGRK
jgi:hypothetical protein